MIYVVGSGLSSIAATVALVKRGYHPTILDVGLEPENEVRLLKARLASLEPEAWRDEDVKKIKQTGVAYRSGIPQKLSLGSDFAYRDLDTQTSAEFDNALVLRSFARGGLSNVWGAVIQPFSSDEFQSWPLSPSDLAPHYSAVRELMCSSFEPLVRPSAQARALYTDMVRNRAKLERCGIQFDYAKLAVRSSDYEREKGCRSCGLCLYGCPYDSIFAAGTTLSRLIRQGFVSHIPNVIVDRVSSSNGRIRVESRSVHTQESRVFEGHTVFIAAGMLESARIVLNSSKAKAGSAGTLRVYSSDIFTVPMLRYRSVPNTANERMHTLCQIVMNIHDAAMSEYPVHMQLYGYNDLYPDLLACKAGILSRPLKSMLPPISERLFVAFGYLHSRISSAVYLIPPGNGAGKLRVRGELNPESRRVVRKVIRKLFRNQTLLQTLPVAFQVKFDLPGGGLRSGGCFPMRRFPAGLETTVWGCIPGLPDVHLVDSCVLPSIPAGPIAFTVMANAHRIATQCPIADDE